MKLFTFALFILLNGCVYMSPIIAPGFYVGTADVAIKSKELLSGAECKYRCYKNKK